MNGDGRRSQHRRGRGGGPAKAAGLWDPVPELAEPELIAPAADPKALVRSLGDPPLPGHAVVAGHYVAAVVERAAQLATALATAAGLVDDQDDEEDEADDDEADDDEGGAEAGPGDPDGDG